MKKRHNLRKAATRTTERNNPRSRGLDQLPAIGIVRAINREDATVARAVARELPAIARAATTIARAIEHGGRLIYIGAGTSGRLATLDAAECPPTFGVPPTMVRAIIAGGRRALTDAVEGAEDSAPQGARDLAAVRVTAKDVVVGITASGTTPYVLGAIKLARKRGAATVGITANPGSALGRVAKIMIVPETGPEVVAGSTRMKAGTAQKMVLNLLSTSAMVLLGRVYNNWMVDVALTNEKLRRRGLRILEEAAGVTTAEAQRALTQARSVPAALVMLKTGAGANDARRRLKQAGGNLRRALGE